MRNVYLICLTLAVVGIVYYGFISDKSFGEDFQGHTIQTTSQEFEGIFWHNDDFYSGFTRTPEGKLYSVSIKQLCKYCPVMLVDDLEYGKKPHIKCELMFDSDGRVERDSRNYCDIHINSLDDLNTGDMTSGKYSHPTKRIQ